MFDKPYDKRLFKWRYFRSLLENSIDPLQDTIDFYKKAPLVGFQTDPWDQSTWPGPWELIQENIYCEFCLILGIYYTLELTDRFSDSQFKIYISSNNNTKQVHYILYVNNNIIGYDRDRAISITDLPSYIVPQLAHTLPQQK
jgi:hypothetical protein